MPILKFQKQECKVINDKLSYITYTLLDNIEYIQLVT